ncbi:Nn.00g027260.m01.CDS01 [Neocucurbitaria sp. VM-36]
MSSTIPLGKHIPQLLLTSALSTYGLYLSYQNITRLQQYEKQSEKAAEWSNTAAQRLHKTRTTQTSGTVTLLISFLTSTTLLLFPHRASATVLVTASLANTVILYLSRTHMANFWNESNQTRVPFVEKFNEAVRGSEKVVWILGTLSFSWAADSAVWASMEMGGISGGNLVWGLVVGSRVFYMAKLGWGI